MTTEKEKSVTDALAEFNISLQEQFGVSIENVELKDSQQRSEDWFNDRLGLFTGSKMKDLMTCKSRAKGKDWGAKLWLLDFGETAMTYIIERAIERTTGERIFTPTTWQMRWGIDHEDEGREYCAEKFNLEIEEVSFMKFLKNAGASPDGVIIENNEELVKIGFELKCPATVQSHYKLMNEKVAEGHDYFWQTQAEMLALRTDQLIFATYDPRYPDDSRCEIQTVELSELHASAMLFRCIVGEKIVQALMSNMKTDVWAKLTEIGETIPERFEDIQEWINIESEKLIP